MSHKQCRECNVDFTPLNTRNGFCSDLCRNKFQTRAWRLKNPDKSRSAVRRWRDNHPNYIAPAARRYYSKHKDIINARIKKYKQANPEKHAARTLVNWSIRCGMLIRPDHCSQCGIKCKPDAHHHKGYDRPLEVQWLCRRCHCKITFKIASSHVSLLQ